MYGFVDKVKSMFSSVVELTDFCRENRLPGGPDYKPIPHFDRRVELSSNLRSVTNFIHKFPRYDFTKFLCTLYLVT